VTLGRILESGEIKYYVRFCLKHPCQWSELFHYYFRRVVIRVQDKAHFFLGVKNRFHHYPDVIREHVQSISVPTQASKTWFLNLPSTGWSPESGPDITSWAIPLATYSCDFKDINWFREERDKEDTFALHRFGWLLRWLSLHPAQKDLKEANSVILDWISKVSPNKHHATWETYSASERVVNWLLYLCATKDYRQLDIGAINTIEAALLEHLDHISHHLEYHNKTCNNHILNNARALYIGGRILGLPEIFSLAKALFQKHLHELINPEGILQEASSHYQLLLTRTMVEVWWAAHTTDDLEYAAYLSPIVFSMISSSLYMSDFSVKEFSNDFPRVGDISPDYPVSWFYPRPEFNHGTESWWGLWNSEQWSLFAEVKGLPQCIPDGLTEWKWLDTRQSPFRIFVYLPKNYEGVYPVGHGHMDFGGFLLYDAEGLIFTDRGRCSYNSDKEGMYGFSARSHNTTLINGLPLVPDCRGGRLAYKKCLNTDQKVSSNETGSERRITWETRSIDRLGKSLKWNREIILRQDHFEIIETLFNPRHIDLKIETYFHIAPGWELDFNKHNQDEVDELFLHRADRTYRLMVERFNGRFSIDSYRGSSGEISGWHSPDYGVRVPAITLRLSFQIAESCKSRVVLCPI
jgi:hypothetical protein